MATNNPADALMWVERPLSLVDILKETTLPTVVKMAPTDSAAARTEKEPGGGGALIQQPLLLYSELKGFKVVARNVSSLQAVPASRGGGGGGGGARREVRREAGSVIVLPVEYQDSIIPQHKCHEAVVLRISRSSGPHVTWDVRSPPASRPSCRAVMVTRCSLVAGWFRLVEDPSVPVLNIASLARIMPVLFFSAQKFPGFSLLDPLNKKDIMYEKLFFPSGVYRVISLFEDFVKYKSDRAGITRKLLRCLVCESQTGIDVLVPFDVTGEFYIVEHVKPQGKPGKSDNNARAYTLKQLVAMGTFTKPTLLKLLLGDHPNKPCGFTGIIKVVDIIKDWTVVATTLDGNRKLLELPVAPFPQFLQAHNARDLLETGPLLTEHQYMKSGAAEKYAREIKVREKFAVQNKNNQKDPPKKMLMGSESERVSRSEKETVDQKQMRRKMQLSQR